MGAVKAKIRNTDPYFMTLLETVCCRQPQPYNFQYEVKDQASGNDYNQQESSDGNTVTGEYKVLLPDGRRQIVKYSANDQTGFVADVQYEGGGGGGSAPSGGGGYGGGPSPPGGSNTYLPPNGRK